MMKSAILALVSVVAFLCPVVAFGYAVNLHYGWGKADVQAQKVGDYDYLGVQGSVYSNGTMGTVYDARRLPAGYKVTGYRVLDEGWEAVAGSYRVGVGVGKEVQALESDDPGGLVYVGSANVVGYSLLTAVVKPMRMLGGSVSVLRQLDIQVDCEPGTSDLVVGRRSRIMDDHLRGVMGSIYGQSVGIEGDWPIEDYKDWVSDGPSLQGGVVDCVILTRDDLVTEFQRLATWHDRFGIRTVVRTITWVDSHYSGSDEPERIRNFLRDAYEKWGTVYVLIGGDASVVPIRYAWTNHYGGAFIPTDEYYDNLEGTWNADGDNIFGEWGNTPTDPGDSVTFYPQVFVGRAPVRNSSETHVFVDKVLAYALNPPTGFATSAAFLGEVIFPQDWQPGQAITLDGGAICDTAAKYFPAYFDTAKFYQRDGHMNRTICLQAYSHGYNYTVIAGHGDPFRTSAAEGDPPYLFTSDFDTLSNTGRCGLTYALNCNNNAIDVDCIFRHLLLSPLGGNTATYATTRYDFPNVGQYFLNEFFDYLFVRGVTRLGDVCTLHHSTFVPSALDHDGAVRWTMLTYILLGDPAIRLWVKDPVTLQVTDGGAIALNDSLYAVQVNKSGSPVSGAVVTLVGDRGEYGVALTGADGYAHVPYRPKGLGWIDLTVSGDGLKVYQDSVQATGSGGRLYVSSTSINDGVGWIGNSDGQAGWGERVGLGVGLKNGGSGTLTSVVGNLTVVPGCSLHVDLTIDGSRVASQVHLGKGGTHPVAIPFDVPVSEGVFDRAMWEIGEETGCWLWLDALGWHVRFGGDGASHTYSCTLTVYGNLLGASGEALEPGDSVKVTGGQVQFGGRLDSADVEDGSDLVVGDSLNVSIFTHSQSYGSVGSSEVVKTYDVWFLGGGIGNETGVWFQEEMTSGSNTWRDWFRVPVFDGDLSLERVITQDLGGGAKAIKCGIRNVGAGGLRTAQGKLRGLSGVVVTDSTCTYGNMASGAYAEGDGYQATELGGPVRYQVKLWDAYGRVWKDTVNVRTVAPAAGLTYEASSDNAELWWTASTDSLFKGYDVYRADEAAGPFAMVGRVDGYAHCVDQGLGSEESYYYYVRVRDRMGNLSTPSNTLEVWTGSPSIAGWPVPTTNALGSSPVVADIDRDGYPEVIAGSRDECVYVWRHDGTLEPGWPRRTGDVVISTPAVANLDNDPQLEIVVGSRDGYLYAYNYDGTGLLNPSGVFRQLGGYIEGSPAIDDLDGDKDMEIVAGNNMGQVYIWHHDGRGFLNPTGNGYFAYSGYVLDDGPTIADIDGDGHLEIVVATTGAGIFAWHLNGTGVTDPSGKYATAGSDGSAAVGDIDNDGKLELVIGTIYGFQLIAYNYPGYYHAGWPVTVDNYVSCSPALACLDGDNKLDVIAGTVRRTGTDTASVYVFSDAGVLRPGWPKRAKGDFYSTPVVGDIDGDGQPEIIATCTDGRIYAWHKDGTSVKGWPRNMIYEFESSPTICDLDKDGRVDLVVGCFDGLVHAFDIGASYNKRTMEWPKLHHDLQNTNLYKGPSKSDVPPVDPDQFPRDLVVTCYPSPAQGSVHVRLGVPSSQVADKISVDVFDVRGRLVSRVAEGTLEPGFHDIEWNGQDAHGEHVSSGIYFLRVTRADQTVNKKIVMVR